MKVGVSISRQIVINGQIDAFNVDTSSKDVRCDTDTLVELLELFVSLDTDT